MGLRGRVSIAYILKVCLRTSQMESMSLTMLYENTEIRHVPVGQLKTGVRILLSRSRSSNAYNRLPCHVNSALLMSSQTLRQVWPSEIWLCSCQSRPTVHSSFHEGLQSCKTGTDRALPTDRLQVEKRQSILRAQRTEFCLHTQLSYDHLSTNKTAFVNNPATGSKVLLSTFLLRGLKTRARAKHLKLTKSCGNIWRDSICFRETVSKPVMLYYSDTFPTG